MVSSRSSTKKETRIAYLERLSCQTNIHIGLGQGRFVQRLNDETSLAIGHHHLSRAILQDLLLTLRSVDHQVQPHPVTVLPRTLVIEAASRRPSPKDLVDIFLLPRVELRLYGREVLEGLKRDGEDLGVVGILGEYEQGSKF